MAAFRIIGDAIRDGSSDEVLLGRLKQLPENPVLEEFVGIGEEHLVRILPVLHRLPTHFQEKAISCLSQCSSLTHDSIKPLLDFCLMPSMESSIIYKVLRYIGSAYERGRVENTDSLMDFYSKLVFNFNLEVPDHEARIRKKQTLIDIQNLLAVAVNKLDNDSLLMKLIVSLTGNWGSNTVYHRVAGMCMLVPAVVKATFPDLPASLTNIFPEYLIEIITLVVGKAKEETPRYHRRALVPLFAVLTEKESILAKVETYLEEDNLRFNDKKVILACVIFCEKCRAFMVVPMKKKEKLMDKSQHYNAAMDEYLRSPTKRIVV